MIEHDCADGEHSRLAKNPPGLWSTHSERIRTYNIPQGCVIDHCISLTLYELDGMMECELDDLGKVLMADHKSWFLAELGESR
jgi:protein subunit release factor A